VLRKWQEFEELVTPMFNFGALREAYQNSTAPTIYPILILVKDLTFIEDGNLDWRNKNAKILNFEKMRLLGHVIAQIKEAQHVHYPFSFVNIIQAYLENVYYVDNVYDLNTLSKAIEKNNSEL